MAILSRVLPLLAAPLLAAPLIAASVTLPAHAHVTGDSMRSAGMQATTGLQLNSGKVAEVFCDLHRSGFNHVTLNPIYQQDTPTSTEIRRRVKAGVEPSPTDDQLRQAIRHAHACGLGVVIKPHLELADGSWRAKIVGSDAWQASWDKVLLGLATIGTQEGADTLVIGTEQKGATLQAAATPRWLHTIAQLREAAPGLRLTYAAYASDELTRLDPRWVKRLDYISTTYYPRPDFTQPLTVANLEAVMLRHKAQTFDAAYRRYGLHLMFAEAGFRSIDIQHYYAKGDELAAAHRYTPLQTMQYEAFLRVADSMGYVDGVMLYRAGNTVDAGKSPEDVTFTWQNKPAASTVTSWFTRP